ncbi:phage virion morphogenesis protein [Candidatus Sororendozoicomonas aggregata]|uniref:phage virion morphogenesis protein n=1 Tax=Candidatus Sororendozoicomonas aggregata TaxID=3073239 RepID=UPI002ED1B7AA
MPSTIELRLNANETLHALNDLVAAGADLSPVMRQVAGILADAAEQAFASEADPTTGQSWQPLTEAHQAKREEKGYTGPTLQMTGQLAASIQSDYGRDYAQVGSNLVYGAIHQHGGTADMRPANAAIPARPFLGASDEDRDEILDILQRHLADRA